MWCYSTAGVNQTYTKLLGGKSTYVTECDENRDDYEEDEGDEEKI